MLGHCRLTFDGGRRPGPAVFGLALVASAATSGCAQPSRDRSFVDAALVERTGHGFVETSGGDGDARAVELHDGLDEDEAVALALRYSPSFAADMARLRTSRADFREAARIANPRVSLLGPVGAIRAAASLFAPLFEAIQLPQRTEAAARALESVAESLVQSGLDLVRDVRVAHAEACLASERLAIYEELGALANGLAEIAESRSSEGDASPADASAIRADAYIAIDQVAIARRDRVTAIARLQVLLGREAGDDLEVVAVRPLPAEAPEATDLLRIARAGRPDVRAAELELQSAAARAGWERTRIFNLAAQVDVQWDNSTIGARMGGVLELPIFNQNQGGVGRADAAIERSAHRVDAVRQQVTFEVVQARARLEQSLASLSLYERNIVPPLREALDAATLRYELGDDSYLIVLDALKRLRGAQLRHVELEAEVRRSRAELERAVGARLQIVPRREPAAAGSGT